MRKSRRKAASINHVSGKDYMAAVNKLKDKLSPGEREIFIQEVGITSVTLANFFQGYYMRNGIKVSYRPMWLFEALVDWLDGRKQVEQELIEKVDHL